MEINLRSTLALNINEEPTILQTLKSSIDQVRHIRKKTADSTKKLEIKMSPSYVLKDKALDYSNLLSAVPELKQEKPLNHARKSSGSKFSTKIEFVKPIQRTTDSPCSVQSHGSFEKSVSNDESLTKELFSDSSKVFRSKNSENLKSLIQKAKQEIQNLRNNKTNLQSKLKMLEDSLRKIEEIDKCANNIYMDILEKTLQYSTMKNSSKMFITS